MKRVFLGFEATADIVYKIKNFKQRYKDKFAVRWVSEENLHITLLPPFNCSNTDEVISKISSIENFPHPFTLLFDTIEFGPSAKNPRLIWVKGETPPEVIKLRYLLLKKLSINFNDRNFLLHITIARFKKGNFKRFPFKFFKQKIFWKTKVSYLTLYQSILLPEEVKYKKLFKFQLS